MPAHRPTAGDDPLPVTYEEFDALADRLDVPRDIRADLYPAVRDLLLLAAMLNRLAPELSKEIPVDALTIGVSRGLR
jgi:hypothetical protein